MSPQELFNEMYDKLGGDFQNNGGAELLNELIKGKTLIESATLIADLFTDRFDNGKHDDLEWLLKEILNVKRELAAVDLPENPIFIAAVRHGVYEVYRGYVENCIEIIFKGKPKEKKSDCYFDLSTTAQEITDEIFPRFEQYFKGMHYNSVFGNDPENPRILWITPEDVSIYEKIVKYYNSIIGRRDIIEDLNSRAYEE